MARLEGIAAGAGEVAVMGASEKGFFPTVCSVLSDGVTVVSNQADREVSETVT
jgi:hypothetical protein